MDFERSLGHFECRAERGLEREQRSARDRGQARFDDRRTRVRFCFVQAPASLAFGYEENLASPSLFPLHLYEIGFGFWVFFDDDALTDPEGFNEVWMNIELFDLTL